MRLHLYRISIPCRMLVLAYDERAATEFGVEDFDQQHAPTDDFATISQDFLVRAVQTLVLVVQECDAGAEGLIRARSGRR